MLTIARIAGALVLLTCFLQAQKSGDQIASPGSDRQAEMATDTRQLRNDVQRLKTLVDQMRNNLAFVQTSQTPLKHQFELEADAWQVIVEQMDHRLARMEKKQNAKPQQK